MAHHSAWLAAIASLLSIAACVEVRDVSSPAFQFKRPINSQSIAVDVESNVAILGVETRPNTVRAINVPMRESGAAFDRFEAELEYPTCTAVAEFEVLVTIPNIATTPGRGTRTVRRPRVGWFSHAITGLPDDCRTPEGDPQLLEVDSFDDFVDQVPGDGFCLGMIDTDPDTPRVDCGPGEPGCGCSLRAAVMEANERRGPAFIRVPAGRYVLSWGATAGEDWDEEEDEIGDLDITDDVVIQGFRPGDDIERTTLDDILTSPGADQNHAFGARTNSLRDKRLSISDRSFVKVDGDKKVRGFHVIDRPGGRVTNVSLENLAVVNGSTEGHGGGILNINANLTLKRVALAGNRIGHAPGVGSIGSQGGGIWNSGLLSATDLAITGNRGGDDAANIRGAGLYNTGEVYFNRTLLAYNGGRFSSALANKVAGTVSFANVTLYDNTLRAIGRSQVSEITAIDNDYRMEFLYVSLGGQRANSRSDVISSRRSPETMMRQRAILGRAPDPVLLTYANSLFFDNVAPRDHQVCLGQVESRGGNVTDHECASNAPSAATPDYRRGPMSAILSYEGGFLPVAQAHVFCFDGPGAACSRDRVRVYLGSPGSDMRGPGFPRAADGDGDGRAAPDAGAFEGADAP